MKRKVLIVCLISLFLLSSCTKKEESTEMKENKEKIPEELTQVQENNAKIIEEIEKIMEEEEEPIFVEEKEEKDKKEEEDSEKEQDSQEQGSGTGGQSAGQSGGSQDSGNPQSVMPPEEKTYEEKKEEEKIKRYEKIEKNWMDLSKTIEKIHTSWSKYKVKAMEKGINTDTLSQTENYLNNLTIAVGKKEKINSLKQSDKLIFSLGNYFDLYKGNIEGDLNRITYIAREIYLYALEEDFEKAKQISKEYESYFSMLRQKINIEKKDEKHLYTLEISLKDLINSLNYKDVNLVKIKRDVVLDNIEKIKEVAN
ncbi:hypothetical protein [Senegalia massiliensis]|uniref:hypothetical protein n=1 Tax=Senegalia massiliensis TaxID=1720316 RepID=UPI0013EF2634|nr:hypothetical protein [Senegalia massiliensis]